MPRYKLTLEYTGTGYHGWQRTATGPSIQAAVEEACFRFCGSAVQAVTAGRTDAGVHASAQVVHVDFEKEYDPFVVMSALNFHLLGDGIYEENADVLRTIAVLAAEIVPDEFHARYSATARHYEYRILNRRAPTALHADRTWHVIEPLDVSAMQAAADLLVGTYDFGSFRDTKCQAKSPIKTLEYLNVHSEDDEVIITTGARSFLHHQVRIMAGTLRLCGNGKWSLQDLIHARDACDRKAAGPTAPPEGLTLVRVDYP